MADSGGGGGGAGDALEKEIGKFSVEAAAWSGDLAAVFLPGFDGDDYQIDALAALVAAGGAECLQVLKGGESVGFYVGRPDGMEYELIVAGGGSHGDSLTREILPLIEQDAARRGFVGIKISTFRRGLMALLGGMGYRALSVQFWKGLEDGRKQ